MKPLFQRLTANGKAKKLALVAVARKLIVPRQHPRPRRSSLADRGPKMCLTTNTDAHRAEIGVFLIAVSPVSPQRGEESRVPASFSEEER